MDRVIPLALHFAVGIIKLVVVSDSWVRRLMHAALQLNTGNAVIINWGLVLLWGIVLYVSFLLSYPVLFMVTPAFLSYCLPSSSLWLWGDALSWVLRVRKDNAGLLALTFPTISLLRGCGQPCLVFWGLSLVWGLCKEGGEEFLHVSSSVERDRGTESSEEYQDVV